MTDEDSDTPMTPVKPQKSKGVQLKLNFGGKKEVVDMSPAAKAQRTKEAKKEKKAKAEAKSQQDQLAGRVSRGGVDLDALRDFKQLPTLETGGVHGGRGYFAQALNAVLEWVNLPPNSEGFVALEQTEDLALFLKRASDPRIPVRWLRQLKDTIDEKESFTLSGSDGKKYFRACLQLLRSKKSFGPFRFILATSGKAMLSSTSNKSVLFVHEWKKLVDPSGHSASDLIAVIEKVLDTCKTVCPCAFCLF